MAKIDQFEDILVWQKSKAFILNIYRIFLNCKDFSFKDQILRASVSIMNNIAKGFEKGSNKDFKKFLFISKGSSAEVRSMLYLAKDLNYLSLANFDLLTNQATQISKMLSGFIKTL